jgi:adenylate cyclase class IV
VPSSQKRHNYIYHGVELALKHSAEWGHHLELEVMIDDLAKKPEAEKLIEKVAGELGVQIMTDQELKDLTDAIEAKNK